MVNGKSSSAWAMAFLDSRFTIHNSRIEELK